MEEIIAIVLEKLPPNWLAFFLILLLIFKFIVLEFEKAFNCMHKMITKFMAKELNRNKDLGKVINQYNRMADKSNRVIENNSKLLKELEDLIKDKKE